MTVEDDGSRGRVRGLGPWGAASLVAGTIIVGLVGGGCKRDKPLRELFGARVEPPGGLRIGMTIEAAVAAMPGLGDGFGGAGSAGGQSPGAHLRPDAQLIVNTRDGRVSGLTVAFDESAVSEAAVVGELTASWGRPDRVEAGSGPALEWRSEATAWRARLSGGSLLRLEFTPYRPVKPAYFGDRVGPPGPLSRLRLGMTLADARAIVPDLGAPQAMGPGQALAHVDGGGDGLVGNLWFDGAQRLSAVSLDLPSAADAASTITAAWHAGIDGRDQDGKPTLTWSDPATGWQAQLVRRELHDLTSGAITVAAELRLSRPADR